MMKNVINLFALLLPILVLTSCSSDAESVESTAVETAKSYSHTTAELELLDLVNAYRVENGLNALQIIQHISYKSEEHNDYMIATNTVSHDNFSSRKANLEQVVGAVRVGENVAYGFSTPQATLNAWIASEGHRVNLLGNYTHYGLSIRENADGRKYYTNIFVKK
jgi:uncharacterized protein YkwD